MTADEIKRLKDYVHRAEAGERLTPEKATELRDLAEIVARENAGASWVTDLLKIAIIAFGMYGLGQLFKKPDTDDNLVDGSAKPKLEIPDTLSCPGPGVGNPADNLPSCVIISIVGA